MNKIKGIIVISILSIIVIFTTSIVFSGTNIQKNYETTPIDFDYNSGGEKHYFEKASNLFIVSIYENDIISISDDFIDSKHTQIEINEKKMNLYKELMPNKTEKIVFIVPIFTELAYSKSGFYDYYQNQCDESCLTVPIKTNIPLNFHSSENAANTLRLLNYEYITDIEIEKNPNILNDYDKVIVLHNEYVSQTQFDAITSHPKVIYLYPNALYGKINVDFDNNTISLLRGHGYPEGVDNGFNWEYDNTRPFEFDTVCENWKFDEIPNGIMLNCYPENIIYRDIELLKTIKEF